ncbi:MAG: AsmA family protein [Proteobacteria bacterium]|nr:AsmA family protein [Pseudomonadota bacterium]
MGRLIKVLLYFVAGIAALLIIVSISFFLLFDPNDFRDNIATAVKRTTGRELLIEGDLEVSLFPWLAIELGKTSLGNTAGFGDAPFASFTNARLSIRLLPLLLRREISIGTAELETLHLNLAVDRNGRSNWQDFIDASEAAPADAGADNDDSSAALDIDSIAIRNASIHYYDAPSGETYRLTSVNMTSGRVLSGEPVPLSVSFDFELQPDDIFGALEIETRLTFDADTGTVGFDELSVEGLIEGIAEVPTTLQFSTPSLVANTKDEIITLAAVRMSVLGVGISAIVEPFSYADSPAPVATIQVDAFSPRSLMRRLNIEVPETADPSALGKVIIDADVRVSASAIALTNIELILDETTFIGELSVPRQASGAYRFDLAADTINLNRYMAPASATTAVTGADEMPVEIPSDLIRPINARGSLTVSEALVGAMIFENVDLGLNIAGGKLRIHPITATFFEGTYNGDVRIDASGNTPVISVNERISGVKLGSLAVAMFGQENVTGTINGTFKLSGRGADLGAIQRSLAGRMSFELLDGAFEGTDVWYELRRARAAFKRQPEPDPVLPARTQFSTVKASGPVSEGVFKNNDLLVELPFMQLTGQGTVDFAAATIDYRMSARVLEKPEFVQDATVEELDEFSGAVIPLRITGSLSAPSIRPDIEAMLKQRVKEDIKNRLIDKLFGSRDKETTGNDVKEPQKEKDIEEQLKDSLRDLFKL